MAPQDLFNESPYQGHRLDLRKEIRNSAVCLPLLTHPKYDFVILELDSRDPYLPDHVLVLIILCLSMERCVETRFFMGQIV